MTGLEPLIAASLIGVAGSVGTAALSGAFSKKKAPKMESQSPLAGESTKLKPGQKTNAINTSPQGLLSTPTVGRSTILGN